MCKSLPTTLLLLLTLVIAGCAGEKPEAEQQSGADAAADFNNVKTPPAASATDPEPQSSAAPDRTTGPAMPSPQDLAGGGNPPSTAAPAEDSEIEIVPESKTAEEPEPPRTTLAGTWEFVVCGFGADLLGLLINVDMDGENATATIVDDSQAMPGWTIDSAEITEQTAHLTLQTHDKSTVDFEGRLQEDGIVRGNLIFGEQGLELVRWLPSQRTSLDDANPRVESENVGIMQDFQPSEDDNGLKALRGKARELGDSALAHELYRRINAGLIRVKQPAEEAYSGFPKEFLAAASVWGERVTARAHLDIAYTMAVCGYSLEQAEDHWKLAQEQLGEDATSGQQSELEIARAFLEMQTGDESEQKSARDMLEQRRAENPYDPAIPFGLAAIYERRGQDEQALSLYSELVALPTGAGDRDLVLRMWKKLGRDPDQIEDHLNEIYKSRVHQFAEEKSDAPRATGTQQTVLAELFTGAACPPCVAADVATGGLEVTYPQSDFIMLRYHEHIPAPDPLATADGQQRGGEYYQIRGTPSLFVNGKPIETVMSMYGPISNAPGGYADLRALIDPLLAESAEITIDLTATAEGDEIRINAGVVGVDESPDSWRLRLVLAEDEIVHPANNGIRLHEMVVRAMPGGSQGISPAEGKLAYNDSVSLTQVREDIQEYISQIPNLPPPPLEMTQMHVVAFVQDDANQEILQATAVPVSGLQTTATTAE